VEARMEDKGIKKAFAYMRVSGAGQISGDGFPRQLAAIQEYASHNNISIEREYREEGVSGTLEERQVLAELLYDLEQNGHGIKTIIIERLDRLSRDLMVQEGIIKDLQKHGIGLISALEGPDLLSTDPTRKFIRQVLGAVAEFDKSMLVEKLKVARQRKAKSNESGKCEGRKGYKELNPAVVALIAELRTQGSTYQQIADQLNKEGYETISGKAFTADVVQNITRTYGKKKEK